MIEASSFGSNMIGSLTEPCTVGNWKGDTKADRR